MDAGGAKDEGAILRTAKSCGPDAPTPESSLREMTCRRRWQKSPVTGYRMHTSLLRKLPETDSLVGVGFAEGGVMSMEIGLGRFGDRRLEKDAMGRAARQL